jgi:uncharacterized protein (TIGR03118 family)
MTEYAKRLTDFNNGPEKRNTRLFMLFFMLVLVVTDPQRSDAQYQPAPYEKTDLVSNGSIWTPNVDSSLVDPQGLARTHDGPWWVADEERARVTLYTGEGVSYPGLSPFVVFIPESPANIYDDPAPVGIVYNESNDFELAPDLPARFLVATRDGTIVGWSSDLYRVGAVLVVDNSPDAAYTGIAIARTREGNRLYAANFRQKRIDVFSAGFSPLLLPVHAFTDPALPGGFTPFNIQNINNLLYVTFAAPGSDSRHPVPGEGSGYVDVFDSAGELVMRIEPGPWMNAPWGIVQAPEGFGEYGGHLLVGNAGSGMIATFDGNSGLFTGFLSAQGGSPIIIPGLHGLGFGNDGLAGPSDTLYFTSGFRGSKPNIFGAIRTEFVPGTGPAPGPLTGPAASSPY